MIHAVQVLLAEMGEAACYYLVIVWAVLQHPMRIVAIVDDFYTCTLSGWILYNEDDRDDENNCYIARAAEVFGYLIGEMGQWECVKEGPDYVLQPGEYGVARYEWVTTKGTRGHFVGFTADTLVAYDPMGKSLTVERGTRVSTRIFRRRK
jgi:hypothetical protein